MSPTARSLKRLRDLGYHADVVERWIPGANIRRDFLGAVDMIGVGPGGTLAVQATSDSNVSARVRKLCACDGVAAMLSAGWAVEVWGWRKNGRRWAHRAVSLTPADLTLAAESPDLP